MSTVFFWPANFTSRFQVSVIQDFKYDFIRRVFLLLCEIKWHVYNKKEDTKFFTTLCPLCKNPLCSMCLNYPSVILTILSMLRLRAEASMMSL